MWQILTVVGPSKVGDGKPQSIFINKVLLGHKHAHLCIICGRFCATAELSSCNRMYDPQSLKYSLYADLDL